MQQRRRFTQTQTLEMRLAEQAAKLGGQAGQAKTPAERDRLNREARQTETAFHERLADFSGLQSPK
jgi:hypothetical protein